jgi:hypothetical protein
MGGGLAPALPKSECRGLHMSRHEPEFVSIAPNYHSPQHSDVKGRRIVKKLSLGILLVLAMLPVGRLKLAAQDPAPQTSGLTQRENGSDKDRLLALFRRDIRSMRKQIIASNLDLTEMEAAKFWPVYEQYAVDLGKIDEDRATIVKEYSDAFGSVSDDQADNLIRRWLDTDISAAQLRQKYVAIVRKVLPAKKAATFFQIDRRVSMMIDVQITSQIPLVQSQLDVSADEDRAPSRTTDFQD